MGRSRGQPSLGQGRVAPHIGDTEDGRGLLAGGMCYLIEWPKSFLKAVIRHYSHHQVRQRASSRPGS